MNLEKLLAENMIRFGTRNLTEHQVRKILKEQVGAPGAVKNANANLNTFIDTPTTWGPFFTKQVATMKALLTRSAITFTNTTIDVAAAWLVVFNKVGQSNDMAKSLKKGVDAINAIAEYSCDDTAINWTKQESIQLNESPDEKGKVLTVGIVTAAGPSNQTPGESSEFAVIISYMNNYNIAKVAQLDYTQTSKSTGLGTYVDNIDVTLKSFIAKKQPGEGSLDLANSENYDKAYLYSAQKYTPATGASVGTQITTTTFTPGPELKSDLPANMFAKMKIKLEPTMPELLVTAIETAKKLGQITGLRIESGASFDEEVKYDNAAFAKEVGLAPNQVPSDPTLDKEGTVTDPMSGGNAFLAYMRGKAIQTAIGNTAGVTPTMVATVATGGAAARFAALYFNIKKPDGSTTITADDLKSVGAKTNIQQLGGLLQILKSGL